MDILQVSYTFPNGQRLEILQGDITQQKVDAIVNAANSYLQHGGGVAAAISQRGGALIQEESNAWVRKQGPVSHEKPAFTRGGNLPCRYVIHAVGPVWGSQDEENKLVAAIRGSLELADKLNLTSLAFPAISTGIFGFPTELAARINYATLDTYFAEHGASPIRLVRLVLYDTRTLNVFLKVWTEWQASI